MKIWNSVRLSGLTITAFAAVTLASCGGGESGDVWTDETGFLRYVPADSPYVFAQGQATPDEVMDKLVPWLESVATTYVGMLDTMIDQQRNIGANAAELEMIDQLLLIAGELTTADGMADAGITRESKLLVYGSGLLPVIRLTPIDGAKLDAAVARIESTVGESSSEGTFGGQNYRYWGDTEARVILAIVDDELVLTFAPTEHTDRHLGMVLGDDLPATNIAASGKLDEIAEKYGFGPDYVGFVDFQQIAATFLAEPTRGIDAELLAMVPYDHSSVPAICKTEIGDLAGVAPRMVVGYTALDGEQMAMNMVVELRQDIAAGLQGITAPVPGNGTFRAEIATVSMAVDVPATLDFVQARLAAMEANPFRCEYFAEIQANVPMARQMLASQPIPPDVYAFKGFVIGLDSVEGLDQVAAGGMPSDISARVLIASDNAPGLVQMGAMFSPELAAMRTDGNPVRVNVPIPLPIPLEVWAALTPTTIGVAVGADGEARLRELLGSPVSDVRPFMSFDMDFQRYYELFGDVMDAVSAFGLPVVSEDTLAINEIMGQLADGPFEREFYDIRFTANGVEMPSAMTFTD
jgi:hypothetical protein